MIEEPYSLDEVRRLVERSGYPFELSTARMLLERGYQVKPSLRFLDRDRSRDYEIDIVADKEEYVKLSDGTEVRCLLRLAIECKSSRLPFVLFGLPAPSATPEGVLDPDLYYLHINSSKDHRHPNRYAAVLFLRKQAAIRSAHHHFNSHPTRFHQATNVEIKNDTPEGRKKAKLHVSDNLSEAVRKLAGFADNQHDGWQGCLQSGTERVSLHQHQLHVYFFLLVHPGSHYRCVGSASDIVQATHTPVFTRFDFRTGSVALVVDFVGLEQLALALDSIEGSFRAITDHCAPMLVIDAGMSVYK
jgi:hypothetical protein